MKETIEKLSRGVKEYIRPVAQVDIETLDIKLEAKKIQTGTFKVFSTNGKKLKGIVLSSDNRLIIENGSFFGESNEIKYKVDTRFAQEGEEISGKVSVVSTGGELVIPFSVKIESVSAVTTAGNIKNLFHFANLVQISYEEAVKLFKSKSFADIFLQDELELRAVYNGLKNGTDVNLAIEEFLVAANKKKPVRLALSKTSNNYKNLTENIGDVVVISKDNIGYASIEIEILGDFIETDRKKLSTLDFAGSNYELAYVIKADRLHKGLNYAKIRFKTFSQVIDYEICVEMEGRSSEITSDTKEAIVILMKKYLDFRMRRINLNQWVEMTDSLLSRIRGINDTTFFKLLQAQIFVTKGQDKDSAWLLENIAEDLLPKRKEEMELYCYYLYVRTIQKRDDEFTEEVIKKIKDYYEGGYDSWQLLWALFYLDEAYDNNTSLKLIRIKEQYDKKMRSPLLYFEALNCFNEVPELLRVLDDFEISVLSFGLRNDYIGSRLAIQINDIAKTERRFNEKIFKILEGIYARYKETEILENICSILIKANKTEDKYFKWFEKGIKKQIKITSLYEYYMYSMPQDYKERIPDIVLMYFVYNVNALPDEKIDLLFSNIVKHKEVLKGIYDSYKGQMEKHILRCIMQRRINEELVDVYKEVLTKVMIGTQAAEELAVILNTYEIQCHSEKIRDVIIVHKETELEDRYHVINGKVLVHIYTEDAAIIFEDTEGNRYAKTVEYDKKKLMDMEDYLKLCYEIANHSEPLVMYYGDSYLKYKKEPKKGIETLKSMLRMEQLIEPVKLTVEQEIIEYYSMNYDGDSLDEYIVNVTAKNLRTPSRIKIIELAIVRGLYERAYELMKEFGFYNIEPRRVMKCCSKMIEKIEYAEDEFLVKMSAYAFDKGKYNEVILEYLSRYYIGTTKELVRIWSVAADFQYENKELEEKIIILLLFTGSYASKVEEVFKNYYKKGAKTIVKKAYLFSRSYDYFVKEKVIEESIFDYIEKDAYNGDEVNDMCEIAYLKHMSMQNELNKKQIDICRSFIHNLTKVNKVFRFYKSFAKYFKLPYSILDKTVVEYKTNPLQRVFIHYIINDNEQENSEYIVEEMKPVCEGVFTHSFVIFFGDNVQYYISEEFEGEEKITESMTLSLTSVEFANDNTHYGTINDILVCRDMKEEKTLENMSKEYLIKKELLNSIFEIKK